jgi:IstB-like ATP binding protein
MPAAVWPRVHATRRAAARDTGTRLSWWIISTVSAASKRYIGAASMFTIGTPAGWKKAPSVGGAGEPGGKPSGGMRLLMASATNTFPRMGVYLALKVLVIDEFGVWPYDRLAATGLFALICARYERGSVILTSNKGFAEWGEVLGDPVIATAILDRLLHHSHILNIRGESYRLREKKRAGLFTGASAPTTDAAPPAQPDRLS